MLTRLSSISPLCAILAFSMVGRLETASADGDLTVTVRNGNLKITGQNNTDHEMIMSATAMPNSFELVSLIGGTTFNGLNSLTVSDVTGNVDINLKSGNGVVVLTEADAASRLEIAGNLKIRTTGNSDAIVILDSVRVVGRTTISTKSGDDAVVVYNCRFHRAETKTGNGNDVALNFDNGYADGFRIQTGNGDDYTILSSETANIGEVRMGNQNDVLGVYSGFFGVLLLDGNGGTDLLGVDEFSTFLISPPVPISFEAGFPGDALDMRMQAESEIPALATAIEIFEFLVLAF